jgi:hypothetical protein
MTEPGNYSHVPVMIKRPYQSSKTDDDVPVRTEALLPGLFARD